MNSQSSTGWILEVGDPTLGAWLITFGYFAASLLCLRTSFIQKEIEMVIGKPVSIVRLNSRSFWLACGFFSLLLGLNKQLDLQTLLIELLQNKSELDKAVTTNRIGSTSFIALITASIGYTYLIFRVAIEKTRIMIRLGLVSLTLLFIYVIYRAATIHQFQGAIQSESIVDKTILLAEPIGVLLLIFAACKTDQQTFTSSEYKRDKT